MRPVPSSIAARVMRAAEPIAERGLDQTKIEDIAEVTGVPKATLYYYFAGKEEVLAFLLIDLLATMTDAVAIAVDGDGSARERLAGAVRAQVGMMADQPMVWLALLSERGRAGRIPEIAQALASAFYQPVERLLAEGVEDGSLRAVPARRVTAMAIFGAVTVSGLAHLMAGEALPVDLADQVVSLLLDGVRGGS